MAKRGSAIALAGKEVFLCFPDISEHQIYHPYPPTPQKKSDMVIIAAQDVKETEERGCNRHRRLIPSCKKRIPWVLKELRPTSLKAPRTGGSSRCPWQRSHDRTRERPAAEPLPRALARPLPGSALL